MSRIVLLAAVLMITSLGFAQERVERKYNKETNLVEATYFYENGLVSQEGTFNTKGKLHGEWTSYDEAGKKTAMGTYENGVRTGTWYFWSDDILKEVEFNNNQIASVTEAKNASGIVKQ